MVASFAAAQHFVHAATTVAMHSVETCDTFGDVSFRSFSLRIEFTHSSIADCSFLQLISQGDGPFVDGGGGIRRTFDASIMIGFTLCH